MEICNKCGKPVEIESKFERTKHLVRDKFYCEECIKIVLEEFCMS